MPPPIRAQRRRPQAAKAASNGTTAAKSGMEQVIDKGKSVVSTAVNGIANFAKKATRTFL